MEQLAQQTDQAILMRERGRRSLLPLSFGSSLLTGFGGAEIPTRAEPESLRSPPRWSGMPVERNLGAAASIGVGASVGIDDAGIHVVKPQAPLELQTGTEQAQASPQNASSLIEGRITGPVRLIADVFRAWNLTNEELASLLDYSGPQLAEDLVRGRLTFAGSADREDRARILDSIHDTLLALFVDAADEARWMRAPIPALGGQSPVAYMIERRIPGMIAVWQLVEHRLANR